MQEEYDGARCPALKETAECQMPGAKDSKPCPIDCKLSSWDEWGPCSQLCGKGNETRQRSILVQPKFGGKKCLSVKDSRDCFLEKCAKDCVLSAWSKWGIFAKGVLQEGNCSEPCGYGSQVRTRAIKSEATGLGARCSDLKETKQCLTKHCAIDCSLGQWTGWSGCFPLKKHTGDSTCGEGMQNRSRAVLISAQYGGTCSVLKPCTGTGTVNGTLNLLTNETKPCFDHACPVNCNVSAWEAWSPCSAFSGPGVSSRHRSVVKHTKFGGSLCPFLRETKSCEIRQPGRNCVASTWSSWSACSKPCASGTKKRSRKVTIAANKLGAKCGKLAETTKCNTAACPIHCKQTKWSEWTNCSTKCGPGESERKRTIKTKPRLGGDPCGTDVETQACITKPCPVPCKLTEWSDWDQCDKPCQGAKGGSGNQRRTRLVLAQPTNGGMACQALVASRNCSGTPKCPQDCKAGAWSAWSKCDATCNGGTQSKKRKIIQPALNGGRGCGFISLNRQCNTKPCAVQCKLSTWSEFTACSKSCGGGAKERKRAVLVKPSSGGAGASHSFSFLNKLSRPPLHCK